IPLRWCSTGAPNVVLDPIATDRRSPDGGTNMDNSTTTWIMVALLLLLIGAAIFMLLRRPGGGDTAVDSRDDSAVGSRDVVAEGRDLGPGSAAPGMDAPHDTPVDDRRDTRDQPFDQHAVTDDADADGRT